MSKTREVGKAVKTMLGVNFNPVFLGLIITPKKVTWEYAVQFRNNTSLEWHPRIINYFPDKHTVSIHNGYHDMSATYVGAETILTMAAYRCQAPSPKSTG
jgi:hypothetical protein